MLERSSEGRDCFSFRLVTNSKSFSRVVTDSAPRELWGRGEQEVVRRGESKPHDSTERLPLAVSAHTEVQLSTS